MSAAIVHRTLVINGQPVTAIYCACSYPTETAAANAWKRADRGKTKADHYSVFRLTTSETREWIVVAITDNAEAAKQLRTVRRAIAKGGQTYVPDDDLLSDLMLRRLRVILSTPGSVQQKANYRGVGGATIDDAGFLRPRKRPQG